MRALILVLVVLGACQDDGPAAAPAGTGTVDWVIDGDTVDVTIGGVRERVRLLGIDTPETKVPDVAPECFGPEASAYTTALLPPGTIVRLERDVVGRDDYGRLLAYVYRAEDNLFVNADLVAAGYAVPLRVEPNGVHHEQFVDHAAAAERADLGLWGACAG